MTDAEKVEKLRAALIQVERHATMNRIWGGMGWRWLPAPPFRIKKIAEVATGALDGVRDEKPPPKLVGD